MADNRYSNQKSALEQYFESLLNDEVEDTIVDDGVDEKTIEEARERLHAEMDQLQQSAPSFHDIGTSKTAESEAEPDQTVAPAKKLKPPSIEEMLAEVADDLPEPGNDRPEPAAPQVQSHKPDTLEQREYAEPVAEITLPVPETAPPVVEEEVTTEAEETVSAEVESPEVEEAAPVTEQAETVQESQIPEWAEEPFQCLLFKVGGLSLAVPLVKLNGVIPWNDNVVETPNQTEWYLGVLMNQGNKVQVIDTAIMVLPPEHRVDLSQDPDERLSHILLVDEQRWGLACDTIGEVVWIRSDEVKWRSNKTRRPWLLGTAIDHMCAVMDTEAFAEMLNQGST